MQKTNLHVSVRREGVVPVEREKEIAERKGRNGRQKEKEQKKRERNERRKRKKNVEGISRLSEKERNNEDIPPQFST